MAYIHGLHGTCQYFLRNPPTFSENGKHVESMLLDTLIRTIGLSAVAIAAADTGMLRELGSISAVLSG